MIEVSEATSIIHEAAHEEANIIFGAVVDPAMEGQVKITVIATGFGEAAGQRQATASAAETPVDLQNYTEWRSEPSSPKVLGSRVSVVRRPPIALPAASDTEDPANDADRLELDTSLETPAFLRRPAK